MLSGSSRKDTSREKRGDLVFEPVLFDDLPVDGDRLPRGSLSVRVVEIDVVETEPFGVTGFPFEVVHQRPEKVASKIDAIQQYGWQCNDSLTYVCRLRQFYSNIAINGSKIKKIESNVRL